MTRWAMGQRITPADGHKVSASTAKLVLLVLADAAPEDGSVFVSQGTIAARSELTRRSVGFAMAHLEALGLIRRATRYRDTDGGRTSDLVTLQCLAEPPCENPSHGPCESLSHPHAQDIRTPCEIPSHPLRETFAPRTDQITTPEPKGINLSLDGQFAEFWELYPKKVAKPAALKAYGNALKRAPHEQIMRGAEAYREARRGQEPKFTAHPTTWLNQDRWNDEPAPTPIQYPLPSRASRTAWSAVDQAIAGIVGEDAEPLTGRAA